MSNYIIAIIFLIIVIAEAIEGFISVQKYNLNEITEAQRIKIYKSSILWGWIQAILCLFLLVIWKKPFQKIGFVFPKLIREEVHIVFGIIVYVISFVLFLLLTYQITMFIISEKYRVELAKIMKKKSGMQGVDIMLPITRREKKWFSLCTTTAAIGEEIVFRGFLFFILGQSIPGASPYLILVIGAFIFGVAHMYQGISGIIRTGLTGALLGALYLTSGALLFSIILHFIIDISANFLYEAR